VWLEPELVGTFERLLGTPEIAEASADLTRLVERLSGQLRVVAQQLLGRSERLRFSQRPIAPEACDLGPVDPTHPRIRGLGWDRLDPGLRGLRPFARPAEVRDLQAGADHVAEDRAREEVAHLSSDDRGHGLVEKRHPLGDPVL
jgi:hypothetical protein